MCASMCTHTCVVHIHVAVNQAQFTIQFTCIIRSLYFLTNITLLSSPQCKISKRTASPPYTYFSCTLFTVWGVQNVSAANFTPSWVCVVQLTHLQITRTTNFANKMTTVAADFLTDMLYIFCDHHDKNTKLSMSGHCLASLVTVVCSRTTITKHSSEPYRTFDHMYHTTLKYTTQFLMAETCWQV